eukprot:3815162-Alexandrium_andersonii.AAC.1
MCIRDSLPKLCATPSLARAGTPRLVDAVAAIVVSALQSDLRSAELAQAESEEGWGSSEPWVFEPVGDVLASR